MFLAAKRALYHHNPAPLGCVMSFEGLEHELHATDSRMLQLHGRRHM